MITETQRIAAKRYRARKYDQGLCAKGGCWANRVHGKTLCAACGEKSAIAQARLRAR